MMQPDARAKCVTVKDEILARGGAFHLVSTPASHVRLEDLKRRPGEQSVDVDVIRRSILTGPADKDGEREASALMSVYLKLNRIAFAPEAMPLEGWVMTDLGLLPSAFLLVTLPLEEVIADAVAPVVGADDARVTDAAGRRDQLAELVAEAIKLGRGSNDQIPVAGYCAAPALDKGRWVGWSLCSLKPGLGTLAKAVALQEYGTEVLVGVTQYGNWGMRIHRKFGRTRMLAASFDTLHTRPSTLVYETECDVPDSDETRHHEVEPDDDAAHRRLQRQIDAGARVFIAHPGLTERGYLPVRIEDS